MRKKKEDALLKLSKEATKKAVEDLQEYLVQNFDLEVGSLPTEIFLEYISEKVGLHYYNQGIADAMQMMTEKTEELYLLMKLNDERK